MTSRTSRRDVRPRVFVSSVVEGFGEYREAARRGIEKVGGEPVLVNEDFPSLATSPRNACLDGVDSVDIFVSIIGERGGWRTPSRRLVVEEEYDRARSRKLPVLIFLQDVERDSDAQQFAREVSDYVEGVFRIKFRKPEELASAVAKALEPHITAARKSTMNKSVIRDALQSPYTIQSQASLRFVLAPEREEEVFDPVTLGSDDFKKQIYRLGHSSEVELFSYQKPKEGRIEGSSLVIHQKDQYSRGNTVEEVRIQLMEYGQLIIDSNVTGRVRRGDQFDMLDSLVLAEEDIEVVLRGDFRFAAALFHEFDPFGRHQRFLYNVALIDVENRKLERNPQPRSSYSLRSRPLNEPVIAFADARILGRSDLNSPDNEIRRVLAVFSRQLQEQW